MNSIKIIYLIIFIGLASNLWAQKAVKKPIKAALGIGLIHDIPNNLNGVNLSISVNLSKENRHQLVGAIGAMGHGNLFDFSLAHKVPLNNYGGYNYIQLSYHHAIKKFTKSAVYLLGGIGKNNASYYQDVFIDFNGSLVKSQGFVDYSVVYFPIGLMYKFKIDKLLDLQGGVINHVQINAPAILYIQLGIDLNF